MFYFFQSTSFQAALINKMVVKREVCLLTCDGRVRFLSDVWLPAVGTKLCPRLSWPCWASLGPDLLLGCAQKFHVHEVLLSAGADVKRPILPHPKAFQLFCKRDVCLGNPKAGGPLGQQCSMLSDCGVNWVCSPWISGAQVGLSKNAKPKYSIYFQKNVLEKKKLKPSVRGQLRYSHIVVLLPILAVVFQPLFSFLWKKLQEHKQRKDLLGCQI